jgi:hypothetical protein
VQVSNDILITEICSTALQFQEILKVLQFCYSMNVLLIKVVQYFKFVHLFHSPKRFIKLKGSILTTILTIH